MDQLHKDRLLCLYTKLQSRKAEADHQDSGTPAGKDENPGSQIGHNTHLERLHERYQKEGKQSPETAQKTSQHILGGR